MIQRLQSILLILAAVANFAAFFLPYGYAENNAEMDSPTAQLYGGHVMVNAVITDPAPGEAFGEWKESTLTVGDDTFLTIHGLLIGLNGLALVAMVFMFGNRARQLKLVYVGILMLMIQVVIAAAMLWARMPTWLGAGNIAAENFDSGLKFGFFIPILAILLSWWAAKRIQKDEKMVKDMDRFR
ncbi:MAG TPA: DUF4293 family protein [Bacteroidetes bacterium]|nr:DUF4293 family protein [Bacteroidota bacterium]